MRALSILLAVGTGGGLIAGILAAWAGLPTLWVAYFAAATAATSTLLITNNINLNH